LTTEPDIDYRALFDLLPSYISVHDRDLRIVQGNSSFQRDFGDANGRPCYELYKGRKTKCEECIVERTFRDGRMHAREETFLTLNDGHLRAIAHCAPILDEEGQIAKVVKISSSIEEVKMLQRQLELSRQEYKTLFSNVPCYISVQDQDFRIIRTNSLFEKDFGKGVGRHCYEAYKGRDAKCEECSVEKTFMDGQIHSSEETVQKATGEEVQMIVYTAPIKDHSGGVSAVMEMSTDITEVKRLHRELAMLGETLAGTAHTIRDILNGLEGGAYVVQSGLKRADPDLADQGWKMVKENVDLASQLVRDILYCSKERAPEYAEVDPKEIVDQVHGLYEERANKRGIDLVIDLDDKMGLATLDRKGIQAVLTNLVSNGIDACQADRQKNKHWVRLKAGFDESGLVFEVADNGIGMDEEIREKAFKGFFSTKGGQGTGLGLLITEKVIREHGGTISVESQPGEGTVICVRLPRYPPGEVFSSSSTDLQ
jgi:PAS domain S-box-containing protein